MKTVQFDHYGGVEVLEVREVARPEPGPDQVLVAVRAAGINISEAIIRSGAVRASFPATFPSGQGSDLSGVAEEVAACHHAWLNERGPFPIACGDGVGERITAAAEDTAVAAFIDLVGDGYVDLALELGIAKDRIANALGSIAWAATIGTIAYYVGRTALGSLAAIGFIGVGVFVIVFVVRGFLDRLHHTSALVPATIARSC